MSGGAMMTLYLLPLIMVMPSLVATVTRPLIESQCKMEVDSCELLNSTRCLGATLSYRTSSQILANDSDSELDVIEKLGLWAGLQNVPKCWEVIQPFLCAVYMPKCERSGNKSFIYLPGRELCEQTRHPCKVVSTYSGWPEFLQCNQSHFQPGCSDTNPLKEIRFNTTSSCERPLVATEDKNSWYQDVDGCGIQCENPMFTAEEHQQVHTFIAVFGSLCMASTLFTVLSFMIDWKNASRYPALILFFINACFFIGSVGWMAQFIPGARKDIVCRSDGTMRIHEPQLGSGETASCTVIFILVYYFMIAGVTWFVILAYAWHLTFRALGYPRDAIEGKHGHFHLVAWSFPLVLTIVCLALTQIDGDSVSGICFVGYLNHSYRGFFVLLPVGLVLVVGGGFLMSGLVTLIKMKMDTPGLISDKASAKIRETIIRLGIFASFALVFVIVTFVVHVYIFTNEPKWKKSFEEFIICEANVTVAKSLTKRTQTCKMSSRPNLVAMEIHIFAYFGAGIVMSSWVWNKATLITWKRFIKRKFCSAPEEEKPPVKLRKHEVIAQAFSKRREMNDGQISLSFYSVHDDPIGMRFDMNSISSMEMSSAWAAAIPRLITRRGGMSQPNGRRYSDSDVQSLQSTSFGPGPGGGVLIADSAHSPRRNSLASHGSQSHSEEDSRRRKKKKRRHRRNRVTPLGSGVGRSACGEAGGSSLVPSSQCTSIVSSSADPPPLKDTEETQVEVHHENNNNAKSHEDKKGDTREGSDDGLPPQVIDSDSIHSEDSNFTMINEMELLGQKNINDEEDGEEPEEEEEEEEKAEEEEEEGYQIPSQKSAFKKFKTKHRKSRDNNTTSAPAALQAHHHHHHTSTYSMYSMGYMPQDYPPEMIPHAQPQMSPGNHHPYAMNNYPMTFMPQDFYMMAPGYGPMAPPHPFFMSNPYQGYPPPPPHHPHPMAGGPMSPPPMYNPFDSMMFPQQVQPVPYNRKKRSSSQSHDNPAFEVTEIICGSPAKKHQAHRSPKKGSAMPTKSKRLRKMTDDDFPTRSRHGSFAKDKDLPKKSKHFSRPHSLDRDQKGSRIHRCSEPVVISDAPAIFGIGAGSDARFLPSVSSTYHLDRVELEEDFSEESV